MIIFIDTQLRCGSTWLDHIISDIIGTKSILGKKTKEEIVKIIEAGGDQFYRMYNLDPKDICDCIKAEDDVIVISITRDVNDIVTSKCFMIRGEHFDKYRYSEMEGYWNLPMDVFINKFIETRRYDVVLYFWKMFTEYEHKNYYLTTYEDLSNDPLSVCREICTLLSITKTDEELQTIIDNNSFEAITGREKGDSIDDDKTRKGIVGDHLNYFTKKSIDLVEVSKVLTKESLLAGI